MLSKSYKMIVKLHFLLCIISLIIITTKNYFTKSQRKQKQPYDYRNKRKII